MNVISATPVLRSLPRVSWPLHKHTRQRRGYSLAHSLPEPRESERGGAAESEKAEVEQWSGEAVVYGTTVFLTFGTFFVWSLFRDAISDVVYGGSLFSLFQTSVSLGDVSAVMLWTVAYYFASPLQLLFIFLGRFERERPSDWILYQLGKLLNQP